MASAGRVGWTRQGLSGLSGNELIKVGVGEVAARTLAAVTDHDVFQVAVGDVTVESLDRAIEFGGSLRCSKQPARYRGSLVGAAARGRRCRFGEESVDRENQRIAI